MGKTSSDSCSSSSSSIDSSNLPILPSDPSYSSSQPRPTRALITDLRLCLSISTCHQEDQGLSLPREQAPAWPQIKPLLRRSFVGVGATQGNKYNQTTNLSVKVYVEGSPIGRKLDLLARQGYHDLIGTLHLMFDTTILWAEWNGLHSEKCHVLIYEDKEGDWMMVGDVPSEMFLTTVTRLKITRVGKC